MIPPLAPPPERADRLPLWVWTLLAVFLTLRLLELIVPGTGSHLSQKMSGQVDEKAMTSLLTTDTQAKGAFAASFGRPGQTAPDRKTLREALKSAEAFQKSTDNAPGAARRVLILRGLLGQPLYGPGKTGPDPKEAFTPKALAGLPAEDARRYAAEGRAWNAVARGPRLSPAQTESAAQTFRAVPNIRWWLRPALFVLYDSQGNPEAARKQLAQARSEAFGSVVPLGLLNILLVVLGLAGLAGLAYLGIRRYVIKTAPPDSAPPPDVWPTLRETVPLQERRLRAGDLMGVFVLYLLLPDLLGPLLGGFGWSGHFYFRGLLAPLKHSLAASPAESRLAVNVLLSFAAYLFTAAVPIGLLLGIARRKGASIGEELGWNTHRLGPNLLYGVGGYALSLPLLVVSALLSSHLGGLFHAPTPSNPAIPLLAGASQFWVRAMLVLLATVAAPLTEEFLFRGVFYNAAKLRLGVWPAIVLTGLIFGFVHPVGIAAMLPLAVLGGVFAWMAETRKSLVPGMIGHFLQNTIATATLLLALSG